MYKNRKKILLVTATSAIVLSGFGAASWAIINSSAHPATDNYEIQKFAGATINGNATPFKFDKMSINDWMFYSMPGVAVPLKSETNHTIINFYSKDFAFSTEANMPNKKYVDDKTLNDNVNNLIYTIDTKYDGNQTVTEVWTAKTQSYPQGLKLVTSTISQYKIVNNYGWTNQPQVFEFKNDSSSFSYTNQNNFKATYSKASGTSQETNYQTSFISNTNASLWERTFVEKEDGSNTNGVAKDFRYEYKSDQLNDAVKPIKQNFSFKEVESSKNQEQRYGYYDITYTSGSSNSPIASKEVFHNAINFVQDPKDNELMSTVHLGTTFSFLPTITKEWFTK